MSPVFRPGRALIAVPSNSVSARAIQQHDPALPGKLQIAINAAGAVLRNGVVLFSGRELLVSADVEAAREAVCVGGNGLPRCLWYRAIDQRCAHPDCGCFLKSRLLNKWKLKAERCPKGKWHA